MLLQETILHVTDVINWSHLLFSFCLSNLSLADCDILKIYRVALKLHVISSSFDWFTTVDGFSPL